MNKKVLIEFLVLFIITSALGLIVALQLINLNVQTTIVSNNINDIENSIALIAYIIFLTAFLLILIKFFKGRHFIKLFELLAVFGTSFVVFNSLIPSVSLMFSLIIVLTRIYLSENIILKNLASMLAVAGAGSLLGVSLGVMPVIAFIIILSVYDLIAVFGTKHMVTLAKKISTENLSFTYSLPSKEHTFQLGTGDIVIPLIFSVSIMKKNLLMMKPLSQALILPLLILTASIIGLTLTLEYCDRKRIALPALPLQTLLMLVTFLVFSLI